MQFFTFCEGFWPLPLVSGLFHPGKSGSVLFKGNAPNSAVCAMRIEFDDLSGPEASTNCAWWVNPDQCRWPGGQVVHHH